MSHTVIHVTDPEGDFSWVEKNIKQANAAGLGIDITYEEDGTPRLQLLPDVQYVCGGDLFGNGSQNLKLLAFFERAQRDYPLQVVKIAGNREIIMTRLFQELPDLDFIRSMINDDTEPRWIASEKRHTFKKACSDQVLFADTDPKALQVAYLKWALEHTMGSAKLFNSLKAEFGVTHDGDVIDALLDPDFKGRIFEHLQSCDSMRVINQVLYSHGALTEKAFAYYGLDIQRTSMEQFVRFVNHRYHEDLLRSEQGAYKKPGAHVAGKDEQKIARGQLNHDALPNTYVGHGSVVTASYEDKENPVLPSQTVIDYLARNNVRAVVIGHKPFGDKPTFLQGFAGSKAVQFVLADSQNYRTDPSTSVVWFTYDPHTAHLTGRMSATDRKGMHWTAEYPTLQLEIPRNFVMRWLSTLWSFILSLSGRATTPAPLPTETLFGPMMVDGVQQYVVGKNSEGRYAAYHRQGYTQIDEVYTEAEVKQHLGLDDDAPLFELPSTDASYLIQTGENGLRRHKAATSATDDATPPSDQKKSRLECKVS